MLRVIVFKAVVLAVVEGITEFLPISSTGHLILFEELLRLSDDEHFNASFLIVIQLPAIMAVVLYFWWDIWPFGQSGSERAQRVNLWIKILLAFSPAVVLGLLFGEIIEEHLFAPFPVAIALLVGGILLIVIDRGDEKPDRIELEDLSYGGAFLIGLAQCVAMIPGTSRSAATIIGAMLLGLSRSAAAKFSFLLAVPTMIGAFTYTTFKNGVDFTAVQWSLVVAGSIVAFAVSYGVVAGLMNFIRRHNFVVFGYYRIVLAAIVLLALWQGWIG